ncbi:MAG: S-layer homology domain-containing protein [Oscillospiraceae bacterium]|nr:S-layer homology domain-containing protein [Oscillospiraceae bacterium]
MKSKTVKTAAALSLCVLSLVSGAAALAAGASVSVGVKGNGAPVAKNIDCTTYRGIPIAGTFEAEDPEGDAVTFRITSPPKHGTAALTGGDGFTYSPEGKKSADAFSYTATDAQGNTSAEATVRIDVKQRSTKTSYADMEGRCASYAAAHLAEKGVFTGEQLGDECFFRPDEEVTRGEFLALCMAARGEKALDGISSTGFADDDTSPAWVKGYVASALRAGDVEGYEDESGLTVFSPERAVTRAEAAVMLNNVFDLTTAVSAAAVSPDDCPAWAYQATVNLVSAGVSPSAGDFAAPVTRAEAAELLTAAMEVAEARETGGLFSWIR